MQATRTHRGWRHALTAAAAVGLLAAPGGALAQHAHSGDMIVGSTGDGSGQLAIEFEFGNAIAVSFDSEPVPGTSIYTATEPGFDAADEDEPFESFWVLDGGTQLSLEITQVEAGRTAMLLNAVLLDAVGESVVLGTQGAVPPGDIHHHGTMQLILMMPPGTYGTGTISFKLTTTSGSYTESESYTMTLSNGHLAPIEYDGASYDRSSVKCQQTVGKEDKQLLAKVFGELQKCLDKAAALEATEAATLHPATAEAAAARACGDGLVQRVGIHTARAKANVEKACGSGPLGSGDLNSVDVDSHLDFVKCQAARAAGAAYGGAEGLLEEIGGESVAEEFPCIGGGSHP